MSFADGPVEGTGGIVRHISFSNITGTVVTKPTALDNSTMTGVSNPGEQRSCIILNCVPGNTIEHITLRDIHLTFGGGGTADDAARRELPLIANEYFSLGPMPAYGLYARNARAVTLSHVRFDLATPDLRPAVIFDRVRDASIFGLAAEATTQAESLLRFIDATDVLVTAPRVLTPASVFLRVEGRESAAITLEGGDLSRPRSRSSSPPARPDVRSRCAVLPLAAAERDVVMAVKPGPRKRSAGGRGGAGFSGLPPTNQSTKPVKFV